MKRSNADLVAEFDRMVDLGLSPEHAAAQLGVLPQSVKTARHRLKVAAEAAATDTPAAGRAGWRTTLFFEADISWHDRALCAETDPELFFPERGASPKQAKATCRACLVRAECLNYSLLTKEYWGIWGGTSERQRRRLLRLEVDEDAVA